MRLIAPSLFVAARLIVVAASLNGCAHAPKAAVAGPEILTYDAEYGLQNLSGVNLVFPWELGNPGAQPASVDKISWTLAVEGEASISGEEQPRIVASPGTSATGKLVVDAPMSASPEAFNARADKTSLPYTLSATFVLNGAEEFEAEWTGDVYPAKRPIISVKPQVARYGDTAELSFLVVITNANPFDVSCDGLKFEIQLADSRVAEGDVCAGRTLGPGTDTEFDFTRQVDKSSFPELIPKLRANSVPYILSGQLRAGGLEFSISLPGNIQF